MIDCLYEPFKHWAGKGSVWIFSDPHFADSDCKFMNLNWITPEEQVKILNSKITKNDTFICLGDCGDLEYIKQIRAGKKVLIKGNHDDKGSSYYKDVFNEVYGGPLFISDKILLSHEPIDLPFVFNIHGHVHNDKLTRDNGLNLAADVCNWEPLNLGKFIKNGGVSKIDNIHRFTINRAIDKKGEKIGK